MLNEFLFLSFDLLDRKKQTIKQTGKKSCYKVQFHQNQQEQEFISKIHHMIHTCSKSIADCCGYWDILCVCWFTESYVTAYTYAFTENEPIK